MWRKKRCRRCCCVFESLQSTFSALFFHLTRIFSSNVLFFFFFLSVRDIPPEYKSKTTVLSFGGKVGSICVIIIIVLDGVLLRGKRRSVRELAGTECTSLGVSMESNPPHWYGKLPDRIWVKRHNKRVLSCSGSPTKIQNIFKQVVQGAKNVKKCILRSLSLKE